MTAAHRRSPQRVLWGSGAIGRLPQELARERVTRPIVVCGGSVLAHPRLLSGVEEALGGPVAGVFSAVRTHTPRESVEAATAALREVEADSVIVVGGGSALVTARAACVLHGEDRPLDELCTRMTPDGEVISPRLTRPKLPIIAVPTTPTTAVGKAGAAVTSPGHGGRLSLFDPATRSRAILLDPEYLASSPARLVRDATLNAFVMAVEGLLTGRSHLFSDALLVHAVRRLTTLLGELAGLTDEDATPERRVDAALLSILVGDGTDTTGGGLTAALSHTIGHHYGAHNGIIDAVLLPHVMHRFPPSPAERSLLAEGLGCPAAQVATRLTAALSSSGAPSRLRDVGVQDGDVDGLAEEATGDFSYRRAAQRYDANGVVEVLRSAW